MSTPNLAVIVSYAKAGITLHLSGTYQLTEPLTVNKPLTLVGDGAEPARIVSDAPGWVIMFCGPGQHTVENIRFEHGAADAGEVVRVSCQTFAARRCTFTGARKQLGAYEGFGLTIVGHATATVDDCVVERNYGGIALCDETRAIVRNCVCRDNQIVGIQGADDAQFTLAGNSCVNNGTTGIACFDAVSARVENNDCQDNTQHGIQTSDASVLEVFGNRCRRNQDCGALIIGKQAIVRDNDFSANRSGLNVASSAHAEVRDNHCCDNDDWGALICEDAVATLSDNVCNNGAGGIVVCQRASADAVSNKCIYNRFGLVYGGDAAGTAYGNVCAPNSQAEICLVDGAQPTLRDNIGQMSTVASLE